MSGINLPLVGIVCDREIIGPHPFHVAGEKYINALVETSKCIPVLIPALANEEYIEQLVSSLDGILLSGGYSMVNPLNYQRAEAEKGTKLDNHRDATSLLLVKTAIEKNIPLFGICRGLQEVNVACGGSLHQKLHHLPQYQEHRENKDATLSQQYDKSHSVSINSGSRLFELLQEEEISVNSLHTQGIDRIGGGLSIEATAPDGLIEAISINKITPFGLAVQWHPEWQVDKCPQSTQLFQAFGEACQKRNLTRKHNG